MERCSIEFQKEHCSIKFQMERCSNEFQMELCSNRALTEQYTLANHASRKLWLWQLLTLDMPSHMPSKER